MFHKISTRVWAIALLGLALSACTSGNSFSPDTTTAFCQPGICVGSTPDSTPEHIAEMMP
jgi:hypothetical protein